MFISRYGSIKIDRSTSQYEKRKEECGVFACAKVETTSEVCLNNIICLRENIFFQEFIFSPLAPFKLFLVNPVILKLILAT